MTEGNNLTNPLILLRVLGEGYAEGTAVQRG